MPLISFVFSSWIINEYYKNKQNRNTNRDETKRGYWNKENFDLFSSKTQDLLVLFDSWTGLSSALFPKVKPIINEETTLKIKMNDGWIVG